MKALFIIITLFAFIFPLALALIWSKKTKCSWLAYMVGALCFVLFVNVLESLIHVYFLQLNTSTAILFNQSPIAYGLYGMLMAGLFEETARLFGFKVLLSKHKTKEISVGYGIGHGGIECILTLGSTYLIYLLTMFNFPIGDESVKVLLLETIKTIDPVLIPLAIVERVLAVGLHISLSILMFIAVNKTKKLYYYPVSIALHMLANLPAALYQTGIINSALLVEMLIALITIPILVFAIKKYKKMEEYENA